VFQLGDFYNADNSFWTDFFVNTFGALIGTGTALFVFYKERKHEKKLQAETDLKLNKQKLHYFAAMIDNIVDLTKKQANHIKSFYELQKNDFLNIPMLHSLPSNDLKRFSEIHNHEEYYHFYLAKFGYSKETVKEFEYP
jgi:cupin superfamily acireductone dioxygenase involved in methionine salvage